MPVIVCIVNICDLRQKIYIRKNDEAQLVTEAETAQLASLLVDVATINYINDIHLWGDKIYLEVIKEELLEYESNLKVYINE